MRGKNRICQDCGISEFTASKSVVCRLCAEARIRETIISNEKQLIEEWGYSLVSGPIINNLQKRVYTVIAPCCGNQYDTMFGNMRKQILNAKAKGLDLPCAYCGPKKRFTNALIKYVEKYGRDYDFDVYNDYMRKVRGLSEVTYKNFKNEINPDDLKRGHHDYHLDHKTPIIECFKQGWTVEQAAAKENLQMLWCSDNLTKGST